jgi:outer membrane protein
MQSTMFTSARRALGGFNHDPLSAAPFALLLLACGASTPALAQSRGDWTLGLGVHNVDPKSDSGTLDGSALGAGLLKTHASDDVKPTFTVEYFVADNVGIEILGALPFKHDFTVDGLGRVGSTKQVTPVLSLQYHFANRSKVTPFLGLGPSYTYFFDTKTTGALAGTAMELRNRWGYAAHTGLDYAISDKAALRLDVRWAKVATRILVNGHDLGKGTGDPFVYGVAYVLRF